MTDDRFRTRVDGIAPEQRAARRGRIGGTAGRSGDIFDPVAVERDRLRSTKHVAHLFASMDTEMRSNVADIGWWLDTSDLSVDQTVDAILTTGIAAGATATE